MENNSNINNYIPSDRTMVIYLSKVKVASALWGRISVTKSGVSKDMNRYTSENSLRNILSYTIILLSTHFILGDKLEDHICDKLSNNAKNTIELVIKLNNVKKVKPIIPDQILGSNNTSLFTHTGSTNNKKEHRKLSILKP